MVISATFFKNRFDNTTQKRIDFEDFNRFSKFIYKLSQRPLGGKEDAELFSPAIYTPDSERRNKNVLAWAGWCAIDVDNIEIEGDINDYVINHLVCDWKFVCYSTASSRKDHPKFRIVFETDTHIRSDDIRHFWYALQTELNSVGDKQCKDLSRMYYIPATYTGAHNFIFSGGNKPINVSELLGKHPYVEQKSLNRSFMDRLPDDLQKKIIQYRIGKMENKNYSWISYEDCPFVNRELIRDYKSIAHIDNSGRYAMIYKIMISIAVNAIKREYPITTNEIVDLIKQLDRDTSNRYEKRSLDVEADRAIEYAYKNV